MSDKYSLRYFILLWSGVFVASSLGFIYIILNVFFSEHLASSSVKDLRYTSYLLNESLTQKQNEMENFIAIHVSSREFSKYLTDQDYAQAQNLIKNWILLHGYTKILYYDSNGQFIDLEGLENSNLDLTYAEIAELNKGYSEFAIYPKKENFLLRIRRKISNQDGVNIGYLEEQKKIEYTDLLVDNRLHGLIVTGGGSILYTSPDYEDFKNININKIINQTSAFEIKIKDKKYDVAPVKVADTFSVYIVSDNLKDKVFGVFYREYFIYFVAFLFLILVAFYFSFYLKVLKPLSKISNFIQNQNHLERLTIESSVAEIDLIAKEVDKKINKFEMEEKLAKESRVGDRTRLVASVAHELNNSLSYIGANIDYINEEIGAPSPDQKEIRDALVSLKNGYDRIKKIVSDLRVFSSKGEIKLEWVSVVDLQNRIERDFSKIDIQSEISNSNIYVLTDSDRFFQILKNLVTNAVQAYEDKEVKILIKITQDPEGVYFYVQDWAGGIRKDIKEKIFDPFFTTKKNLGGAGLGLSLSQNLAEEIKAQLLLKDTNKTGTVFCLILKQFKAIEES